MKSKTILVFPGSNWQIPLIEKSKVLGYRTLVVNPYAESPAFPYADGHLQSDIFDIESGSLTIKGNGSLYNQRTRK